MPHTAICKKDGRRLNSSDSEDFAEFFAEAKQAAIDASNLIMIRNGGPFPLPTPKKRNSFFGRFAEKLGF